MITAHHYDIYTDTKLTTIHITQQLHLKTHEPNCYADKGSSTNELYCSIYKAKTEDQSVKDIKTRQELQDQHPFPVN